MRTWPIAVAITVIAIISPAQADPPSFSTGAATITNPGIFDCGFFARTSAVGTIASDDGRTWTVPARTHFLTGPKAPDLYNSCAGVQPGSISEFDLSAVPVIDAGGSEEFTAYIFADNYFELYVNGKLIAADPVPFTPFNSSVVRFRAERPLTLAIKMVDWEENLGLGSERGRGVAFHPGDGGLVAVMKNASQKTVAITDGRWRALATYISPLKDRTCLKVTGKARDTSTCDEAGSDDGTGYSAAHWPEPDGWTAPGFDDSAWPPATVYTNRTVGVGNKPAYTNFTNLFDDPKADARFVWSSNLVLDNVVLLRRVVD